MDLSQSCHPINILHHSLPGSIFDSSILEICSGHSPSFLSLKLHLQSICKSCLACKMYRESNHFSSPHHHCYSGPLHCPLLLFPAFQCILKVAATTALDKLQIKSSLSSAHDPLISTALIQKRNQSPAQSASSRFFDLILHLSHPCSALALMASF